MVDETGKPQETLGGAVALRLVQATGITAFQALDLITLLGPYNWTSLLREARILNRLKPIEISKP